MSPASNPDVIASDDVYIAPGGDVILEAITDEDAVLWTPDLNINCDTCFEILASPDETTVFTVQVTDENGCNDYDSVTVFVISECDKLFAVPNAFSPNGDGINDVFQIIILDGNGISGNMKIFNRWGEMIFETADITKGWDGTHKSHQALIGGYVYYAVIECEDNIIEKKGTVTVIR